MSLNVDPDSLRQADRDLADVMLRTVAELERFDTGLQAQGEPWGTDDLGQIIGEVYRGAYAMAMNCFFSNLDTLDEYAARLRIAADRYDATDEDSAGRFRQLGSAL